LHYPAWSAELWRWVERPQDDAVAEFVAAFAGADEPVRAELRAGLSVDDLYHCVLVFAKRRAFASLRAGDRRAAVDAFEALATVDIERVARRDLAPTISLAWWAAQRCQAIDEVTPAIDRAALPVREMILELSPEAGVDPAEACGLRLVATPSGPALFGDGRHPYRPDRDLVPIAVAAAEIVEADGVHHVHTQQIAQPWPTGPVNGSIPTQASPDTDAPHRLLLVHLVEAATAAGAAAIVASADGAESPRSVSAAVNHDRLCAVLVARSFGADDRPVAGGETLARLKREVGALLA
jgi:hypothetical protein